MPRAQAKETAVLESGEFPDHVRSTVFRMSLSAWERAEAIASLLYDYVTGLEPEQMMTPRLAGTRGRWTCGVPRTSAASAGWADSGGSPGSGDPAGS